MQLNNLSLAGPATPDTNTDLVWLTQWFVPSFSDSTGGRNFHVYAESFSGGALQCFTAQNAVAVNTGGFSMAYPGGLTALPPANCQSTLGPNGNITIYVPLSMVSEVDPIDNRLHEVTASTMTLAQPANTNPDLIGSGEAGSLFNLIDVAQSYVFDPTQLKILSIARLPNGHAVLNCQGAANRLNIIQWSPDLVSGFQFLARVPGDANGLFHYEDATATGETKRFYRLASP
jgi:hypothetical protein